MKVASEVSLDNFKVQASSSPSVHGLKVDGGSRGHETEANEPYSRRGSLQNCSSSELSCSALDRI
ncbi:hypothetical protein OIDMADRAFT_18312 [Oidiodendron maius Zn]|uniref:Uncharacterized protein n=1 Tax=Oidiodendron maius (strain Zn) TaxID=913774 RepID=A0A0C3HJA5_OIDMZ|nr:hypothetical protein OIDMADRAFT_18312 [Oidiodendron maius Zn]